MPKIANSGQDARALRVSCRPGISSVLPGKRVEKYLKTGIYWIKSSRKLVVCNVNGLNINLVSIDFTHKLTG